MPLVFPSLSYLYEGIEGLEEFTDLRQQEKDDMMESACPIIEQRLGDMSYLGQFTWWGSQAFYNDDDGKNSDNGNHLKDNFNVEYDGTAFLISNSKTVSGASGKPINLFENLLYPGFGEYRVPTTNRSKMRGMMGEERYAYETRTKKQRKLLEQKLYKGNLMTYYYRYAGLWFYKQNKRGGMSESLVSKFHEYIDGAIRYGVEHSLKSKVGGDDVEVIRSMLGGELT